MGQDKSQLIIEGSTLAIRASSLLQRVVTTAIEVGPGVSGLPSTREQPPGGGPLVAIAAGCRALRESGHTGSALVIACDLPLLREELLRYLVEWVAPGSVLPVVRGRPQPLCAKWGRHDLDNASHLVSRGVRSLKHLSTQLDVTLLHTSNWGHVASEATFSDVDSPADLQRLGLSP
jgi:molybdopterin-guanine dinucleotide biosynthesis protein A